MGEVVNGKYVFSLSAWMWTIERNTFLDFVPTVRDKQILILIPEPPKIDPGLYLRPFSIDAWRGVGVCRHFLQNF